MDRVERVLGRLLAEELVDQPLARDDAVGIQHEVGESARWREPAIGTGVSPYETSSGPRTRKASPCRTEVDADAICRLSPENRPPSVVGQPANSARTASAGSLRNRVLARSVVHLGQKEENMKLSAFAGVIAVALTALVVTAGGPRDRFQHPFRGLGGDRFQHALPRLVDGPVEPDAAARPGKRPPARRQVQARPARRRHV